MKSLYSAVIIGMFIIASENIQVCGMSAHQALNVQAYSSYSATCKDIFPIQNIVAIAPIVALEKVDGKVVYKISLMDWAKGHSDTLVSVEDYVEQLVLSNNKKMLIMYAGKRIIAYDIVSKSVVAAFDGKEGVKEIKISHDCKHLFVAAEGSVTIFNLADGKMYSIVGTNDCIALNNNQSRFFVCKGDTVKQYAVEGFYCFKKYTHGISVVDIACNKEDTRLLTCDISGVLRLWDSNKQLLLKEYQSNRGKYLKAFFGNNDAYILAVTEDYKIDILDAITFAPILCAIGGKHYDFKNPFIQNNVIISCNDPYNIALAVLNRSIN